MKAASASAPDRREADRGMPLGWRTVVDSLKRPYPVTLPMVVLVLLVPCYIFIAELMPGNTT